MRPDDLLVIGAWIATLAATLVMAWTPWRLTAGVHSVDLADTVIGRAVSPLHVLVAPVLVLLAPFALALADRRGLVVLAHPHVFLPSVLIALAAVFVAQFVLRQALLKVAAERREALARDQAVLASARSRSARHPR